MSIDKRWIQPFMEASWQMDAGETEKARQMYTALKQDMIAAGESDVAVHMIENCIEASYVQDEINARKANGGDSAPSPSWKRKSAPFCADKTMSDKQNHEQKKKRLKRLGIILTAVGAALTATGFIGFFAALAGGGGPPVLFFLCFIGLPMIGVGSTCLRYGYPTRSDEIRQGRGPFPF